MYINVILIKDNNHKELLGRKEETGERAAFSQALKNFLQIFTARYLGFHKAPPAHLYLPWRVTLNMLSPQGRPDALHHGVQNVLQFISVLQVKQYAK